MVNRMWWEVGNGSNAWGGFLCIAQCLNLVAFRYSTPYPCMHPCLPFTLMRPRVQA